jgi:hypothetical protein
MLIADPERTEETDDVLDPAIASSQRGVAVDVSDELPADGGPICSHCKQRLPEKSTSVCPHCGYYASLGIFMDVDKEWEQLASGQVRSGESEPQPQAKSHLQVWLDLIPPWGWQLIGYNVLILLTSVGARLLLPDGPVRTTWSVTQIFVGLAVVGTCHCLAYLCAIAEDASMSPLDIILRPLKLWGGVVRELPKKLRLLSGATCSITAVIGSMLIIGSLPYAVLLDWGFKQPPKQQLLGAIAARAQQVGVGDEEGLEEAMNEFVDKAGVNGEEKDDGPKLKLDCVIIGYTITGTNPETITSLVIAREHLGKLMFIGTVRGGFDEELQGYLEEFREIPRPQPFVAIPVAIDAQWVQPYYTCRIKYRKGDEQSGRLEGVEYDTMLGKIRF